jgi:general secretion pathway protein G
VGSLLRVRDDWSIALKSPGSHDDDGYVIWQREPPSGGDRGRQEDMWHECVTRASTKRAGQIARATAGTGFLQESVMTVVRRTRKGGFTLVEILIVVIILGILAAIVIPQFTSASQDARKNSLTSQLQTLRSQIELYKLQHLDNLPSVLVGTAPDWSQFTLKTNDQGTTGTGTAFPFGPYLQADPKNPLNGSSTVKAIAADVNGGDASTTTTHGFLINSSNGKIWGTSAKFTRVYDEAQPSASTNDM